MEMTVPCPGCHMVLHVPANAAGRRAKCPACQTHFIVPTQDEVIEETISGWLIDDIEREEFLDEQESLSDTLVGVPTDQAAVSRPDSPPVEPTDETSPPPTKPAVESTTDEPLTPTHTVATDATEETTEPGLSDGDAAGSSHAPSQPLAYPTELIPSEPLPHLVVRDCSQAGVLLAFDTRWLSHEGFCSSLPIRCAFSGVRDRTELCAKPMIFMDRYRGPERSPNAIDSRYEVRPKVNQDVREIARTMGRIASMPPPFNRPTPYFVGKHHMTSSLHCTTEYRTDGGFTCLVLIPDSRVALEWLARVNGTCGPEYELLRSEISLHGSEAWRALPEKVRQHLQVWTEFQPREKFRSYLNDADFGSHDAGLAGLVITDRRLIYHKYHHNGQVRLDADAVLHVRTDGKIAGILLEANGRRIKVGKINFKDMSRLMEMLAAAPGLKVEMSSK